MTDRPRGAAAGAQRGGGRPGGRLRALRRHAAVRPVEAPVLALRWWGGAVRRHGRRRRGVPVWGGRGRRREAAAREARQHRQQREQHRRGEVCVVFVHANAIVCAFVPLVCEPGSLPRPRKAEHDGYRNDAKYVDALQIIGINTHSTRAVAASSCMCLVPPVFELSSPSAFPLQSCPFLLDPETQTLWFGALLYRPNHKSMPVLSPSFKGLFPPLLVFLTAVSLPFDHRSAIAAGYSPRLRVRSTPCRLWTAASLDSRTESAIRTPRFIHPHFVYPQFICPQVVRAGGPPQRLHHRRIVRGGRDDWSSGDVRARAVTQREQQR